jgi:hypothetical protein
MDGVRHARVFSANVGSALSGVSAFLLGAVSFSIIVLVTVRIPRGAPLLGSPVGRLSIQLTG